MQHFHEISCISTRYDVKRSFLRPWLWIPIAYPANKNSVITCNKLNSWLEILSCLKLTEFAGFCRLLFLCFSRVSDGRFLLSKRYGFSYLFSFSIVRFIDESRSFPDLYMNWNMYFSQDVNEQRRHHIIFSWKIYLIKISRWLEILIR